MSNALVSNPGPVLRWSLLALFLAVVIGAGSIIGVNTAPGEWYANLNKPPFNPPNWIFAPVWFALYICIAIAGWRTFLRAPKSPAMCFWIAQMLLNWLWSPTFFVLQLIWPAFIVIFGVWLTIIGFIATSRQDDPFAGGLMVPYLAWVSFASVLNLSIGILN